MNFLSNLLSFVYDKDYCICLYDNKVFIYKYSEIYAFSDKEFIVRVQDKTYTVVGKDLSVKKLTNDELIIEGKVEEIHEKN